MYNTIVVAFDGSEPSTAALKESSSWIKRHGGNLVMIHAVYFDEEEFSTVPEQRERRFELGRNVCYQTRESISNEFGIEVESLVCEGEPPDVITDVATEKKAELIAMGTYGRRGLKRLLMGGVTSKVIVNAPCDVLIVKKSCGECTAEYKSILVPFDGSESSKKALERACRLSEVTGANVTVTYVIPRYEEMVGFFRTESIKTALMQEAEKITNEAKNIALNNGIKVNSVIQDGSPGDMIIETANMRQNDLIVMGTYGWKGVDRAIMGSTTERVIMHASSPVLVVR
ncbi:MAG: universal stress protein [Thermodesulfobacteriota bacterium]